MLLFLHIDCIDLTDLEPLGMAESSQVLQTFLLIQQIRRINLRFICRGKTCAIKLYRM